MEKEVKIRCIVSTAAACLYGAAAFATSFATRAVVPVQEKYAASIFLSFIS